MIESYFHIPFRMRCTQRCHVLQAASVHDLAYVPMIGVSPNCGE